ncbi:RDD family protein [Chitinophaga agrisoli]|uniref:RDD family protein n=1 Tax=Chitinophaga agrisoli TaxID=2607653 RepID=A0A5B2VRF5_9BACT|nr:RDD family protein [Chitinophaga agrisoli]KAA2241625.1 RDD family protein [Chitinophaga agrisoli]
MEPMKTAVGKEDLLGDLDDIVVLNRASRGQRFLNYLIDLVIVYLLVIVFFVLDMTWENLINPQDNGPDDGWSELSVAILAMLAYVLYYTLMECFNKGRTIGKLATGTYAVFSTGKPLTFKTAFFRSLSRIAPFELLSGFDDAPWHDRWTDTLVAKRPADH